MSRLGFPSSLVLIVVTVSASAADPEFDFNREIRPILSRACFSCHGQDSEHREAGLRLDDRDAATSELDSGETAIVPGRPNASELIARITSRDDDLRMPPADSGIRLSRDEIDTLRRWIAAEAPYARHWSFEKPIRHSVPKVSRADWVRNAIDAFVLARLEAAGLEPTDEAGRHTLIRRLSLDLRGLPPTPEEVDRFINDTSDTAYGDLVDRFLADSAYGERWARVWLDLARYADSRGLGSDPLRMNMWRYRDWVIDAFNANMPYDQFTIEQLAGDLLPSPTIEQRMATAFHRNTMTNTEGGTDDEEFRVAAVRDRVDTTVQVWMGLTMGCAKCHNHKYDPIAQEEYYRFYAIFNQTADADRPDESPVMDAPRSEDLEAIKQADGHIAAIKQQIDALKPKLDAERKAAANKVPVARFVRVELPGNPKMLSLAEVIVLSGGQNIAPEGKATQSSTDFAGPPELAIDGNTSGDYTKDKSVTHTRNEADPWWEVDLGSAQPIDKVEIWNRTDNNLHTRLANFGLRLLDAERNTVWSEDVRESPNPNRDFAPVELGPVAKEAGRLNDQLAKVQKSKPTPPTLPIMQELATDQRRKTHIMIRGNFLQPGDEVEPAVLTSFNPLPRSSAPTRLGVAEWLMDPANPLTARVAVNRMWAALFGIGIVETEEDFGTQGEPPSHADLLDWLAVEFISPSEQDATAWDMKRLLRTIVMSATYRQSSRVTPDRLQKDPRNRLFSRGARFRLEAETVRDQALALSGLLSRRTHGPSVYPYQPKGLWRAAFNGQRTWPVSKGEDKYRRGLYTFWRRTVPYPSMATFDAPSREICTVRRIRTNTPLQAFVTLNDPVYVEAAQALARRMMKDGGDSPRPRVEFGLRLCLAREPDARQIDNLLALFDSEFSYFTQNAEEAEKLATDPIGALPEGMNPSEAAAWTVVANVLLNLDAVLTRN